MDFLQVTGLFLRWPPDVPGVFCSVLHSLQFSGSKTGMQRSASSYIVIASYPVPFGDFSNGPGYEANLVSVGMVRVCIPIISCMSLRLK